MTLSRAIITLLGTWEIQVYDFSKNNYIKTKINFKLSHSQEPIIEPIYVNFDVKRETDRRSPLKSYGLFDVNGSIDLISINLSQKDLRAIIVVWEDNLSRLFTSLRNYCCRGNCSSAVARNNVMDEKVAKKLEVFFAQNDTAQCETNVKVTLEGLQVDLFTDAEEVIIIINFMLCFC